MAALDLCAAEPMVPLGDLLQRLEELEGRLRGSGGAAPGGRRAAAGGAAGARAFTRRPSAQPQPPRLARPPAPAPRAAPARVAPASAAAPRRLRQPSRPDRGGRRRAVAAGAVGVRGQGPARLASLLAHAEVVSLGAGELTLAFASKLDADQAEKARAEIEQGASDGARARRSRSSITVGARGRPPCSARRWAAETDAADADRKHREQEARQHPVIRRAQDVFGAALKEIKT